MEVTPIGIVESYFDLKLERSALKRSVLKKLDDVSYESISPSTMRR